MGPSSKRQPVSRAVRVALLLAVVASSLAATAASAHRLAASTSAAPTRHLIEFLSPDHKVWCAPGTSTFCGTGGAPSSGPHPRESLATLARNGKVTICRVAHSSLSRLCLQNWDDTAPVLKVGQKTKRDNIVCTSAAAGITCTIASGPGKGRGFFINATTVRRVGPAGPPPP
jgi:hypothetical protein